MDKINFHLPQAFEQYELYKILIPIFKNEKEKFYDYVNIGSVYDSNTFSIWSGEQPTYKIEISPSNNMKDFYDNNNLSISINASNLLLDKNDLYDSLSNNFINTFHDSKNEIIIGNDLLKSLIDILYPKYTKISSFTKCLSKEDTIKELEKGYDRVTLNVELNNDFEFLYNLTDEQKKKIEIILNPTCINNCGKLKEHYKALSYDIIYRDNTSQEFKCELQDKDFIEKLQSKNIIKNEDLIEKYIKFGFNNFRILSNQNKYYDTIYVLIYYLIKPEYHLVITYRLLNNILKFIQKTLEDSNE